MQKYKFTDESKRGKTAWVEVILNLKNMDGKHLFLIGLSKMMSNTLSDKPKAEAI